MLACQSNNDGVNATLNSQINNKHKTSRQSQVSNRASVIIQVYLSSYKHLKLIMHIGDMYGLKLWKVS